MTTEVVVEDKAKTLYFTMFCVVAVWFVLVYKALFSAITIWSINDIYNHCFIVIPASIFLIYEKRYSVDWQAANTSYLAAIAFVLQLLLYTLGTAADIQLFQHAAIFAMIPTLFWMFYGDRIAWQFKFPLVFILFAIPVGEELIPLLQQITANMSVVLLEWSGIPLFRSGLFIEIPQGKFLVAEACSGVSFLIASIVLGNLYAYMNLVSMKRRLAFVALSICFPILANAIRVYGIILTGYLTDMEHAVGADHLVYGWFFFALVLVCLFLLGELIKKHELRRLAKDSNFQQDATLQKTDRVRNPSATLRVNLKLIGLVLVLLAATLFQNYRMLNLSAGAQNEVVIDLSDFDVTTASHLSRWQPRYVKNTSEQMHTLSKNNTSFNLYYAYYDGSEGELVSSLNKLYEQERWTLSKRSKPIIGSKQILLDLVSASSGNKRAIYYWYIVDGEIVNSFSQVKIKQLMQTLKGHTSNAAIVAVSFDVLAKDEHDNNVKIVEDAISRVKLTNK